MLETDALLAPMNVSEYREIGGVRVDTFQAGTGRVKRMIYPPGFNWERHLKHVVGTDLCMHAHAGFLAHGEIHVRFQDGCIEEFRAPQFIAIEPGHEGWVVGNEPAVLIEFDFAGQTIERLGVPQVHRHAESTSKIALHGPSDVPGLSGR